MHGRRVAVVVGEFGFLAGSIGRRRRRPAGRRDRAGDRARGCRCWPRRSAAAPGCRRARRRSCRWSGSPQAIAAHKAAGLPYLVYLRHPTTGGVMASWGSLGHVTVAEPGALVGFLGPRVFEALYGEPFPEGVQTAENLYAHGIIDAVVPPEEIADILDRALDDPAGAPATAGRRPDPPHERDPRRRRLGRRSPGPGARTGPAYAGCSGTPPPTSIPLNGTGQGEADPGLLIALARFGDAPVRLPRPGPARPDHRRTRWGPGPCARHGAGCGWPPSSACRW